MMVINVILSIIEIICTVYIKKKKKSIVCYIQYVCTVRIKQAKTYSATFFQKARHDIIRGPQPSWAQQQNYDYAFMTWNGSK